MGVDRLSIAEPSELVVTDSIAHQVRLAALEVALAEADKRHGPVPQELLQRARAELATPRKPRRRPR